MDIKRRKLIILLAVAIQLLCMLMIPQAVFAAESSIPIPHPDQFPGEREAVFYSLLEDRIRQYGLGAEYYLWEIHDTEETGVVWAKMIDLTGDSNPLLAIVYDQEPENTEDSSWILELYRYKSGKPICIYTDSVRPSSYQISDVDGTACLEFLDSEGNQKLLSIRDGKPVDLAPYQTEQVWRGYRYTAYLDAEGNYHLISPELADTIEQLSGVSIGSVNPDNTDWTRLYAEYISDLIDHDTEEYKTRFCLYDVDEDGIRELFSYPLHPTVASSEDVSAGVVTADTDCIRILECHSLALMAGDGKISVPSHFIGVSETQRIFSIDDHRFLLDHMLNMYAPGGFGSGETHYEVDGAEVSQTEYESKMESFREGMNSIASGWDGDEPDSEENMMDREEILDYLNHTSGKRGLNGGNTSKDDYSSLIGLQVPGSEGCTDMNSGYAFAIRNLIDLYGLVQYRLEDTLYSGWPSMNGVCWAGLLSMNSEKCPYLAVTRFDYDSLEEFYQFHIYVYSWEGGKLILRNWIPTQDYWVANLDGNTVFVNVFDDGYGICSLDNSTPVQYYMPCYDEYDDSDDDDDSDDEEDEYSIRYQIGTAYGDYDDYQEAVFCLRACRMDLQSIRYYASSDGEVYGISSAAEDLYVQMSGEADLRGHSGNRVPWKELYQDIIDLTSENTGVRYSLVYLDADQIPELVLEDYSGSTVRILTSDGTAADSIQYTESISFNASDRLGSFLMETAVGFEGEDGFVSSVITLSGGRFTIKECGGYSYIEDLYVWSGSRLGSGDSGEALYQERLNQAIEVSILVVLRPKYAPEEVLRLLDMLESGVSLSVMDSWTEEEELSFKEQIDSSWDYESYDDYEDEDDYEEDYDSEDDYEEDYDSEDDYEEDYDSDDDYETAYTGPADLADASADWNAVNEAGLTSGDPVTVPGDYYTDGQERYKETGYILPQSATQYLTEEDIAHLTMKGCCYARNEIYARHGRMFNANELQNYFNSCSWYEGTVSPESFDESYTQSVLNEYEYENAYFLLKYEEEHGMYWPE